MSEVYGFDEFLDALGDLEAEFEKEANKLLLETGIEAETETRLRTPVGVGTPDPGNLRRNMQADNVKDYQVRVGSNQRAPYALFVEEGHELRNGAWHPGVFMLRDGIAVAKNNFDKKSVQMFDRVTKEIHL